jgi:hypothetical protein
LTEQLAEAMKASGYAVEATDTGLVPVISKLEALAGCGRFARLLEDLFACNDKANLHALLFEAIFAWHFERKGKALTYEVVQQPSGHTSIDFLHAHSRDIHVYYELRLLQRQNAITMSIEKQLSQSNCYSVLLNRPDQQHEVIRLQQVLLEKVQDKSGKPIKFLSVDPPNHNILVVDVSQLFMSAIDRSDCVLACYGDQEIPRPCRLGVVGVFEVLHADAPPRLSDIALKYDRLRETIHGILFMRKPQASNPIDFELQSYFVPNTSVISQEAYSLIMKETEEVFTPWNKEIA